MYFAIGESGDRVFIDDAKKCEKYFCPACRNELIIRRGDIVSHHFAHKSRKMCDPWYKDRMSDWHRKLQSMFPLDCQEVVVWNQNHSELHFADVMFTVNDITYVMEFQHSPISRKEFESRSFFYLSLGYKLIWIFDFCECDKEKMIFYTRKDTAKQEIDIVWPGKDRVRFLDNFDRARYADEGNFHIFFHICTGLGEEIEHPSYDGFDWTTWQYSNQFQKEFYFVEPKSMYLDSLASFEAVYYGEEEFYEVLSIYALHARKEKEATT